MRTSGLLLLSGACLLGTVAGGGNSALAQSRLYPQHFDLQEVTLLDGPFKTAMDKNVETLLSYDADRLLTPFVRQSGLAAISDPDSPYYRWEERHPNFVNWCWNPSFALDGHVGGHYLTALALAYAASHDESDRRLLSERLHYMVRILQDCQDACEDRTDGMKGFLGGLPDNEIWTELYRGDATRYKQRGGWVPFYCQHKVLAGLRDAWVYAGDRNAREMFRRMCDWSIAVVEKFDVEAMERDILSREHGGMNETLADAYAIFGDKKYLDAARKYSHQFMIDGIQKKGGGTFLDNRHANTQVPKYIGFDRIDQLSPDGRYFHAALDFWKDVAGNRTVCIGGNSIAEHFLPSDKAGRYIQHTEGPESCNTNNMMKLTEGLFSRSHEAGYADFYEKAMLNHILSTQDPQTGGYVYFTSLRPESYRIYSTVNCAMWCCVGTGMENHSKYGHFIYTHSLDKDTLFVNLFVASRLRSKDFALLQETAFPYGTSSRMTVERSGRFTLALRHPSWATKGYEISINGERQELPTFVTAGKASYVPISRRWKKGDVIEIVYPMELTYETCPYYEDYVAFRYGPVLLAAATTSDDNNSPLYESLKNEYAGDGRMDHSPSCRASFHNLADAPMLIGARDKILQRIRPQDPATLRFTVDVSAPGSKWKTLTLQPFFSIHHARYVVYWNQQTPDAWARNPLAMQEKVRARLDALTLDKVAPSEQQSEAGHVMMTGGGTWCGIYNGESYRTNNRDGWFEYTLVAGDAESTPHSLLCRFSANDAGRKASLTVNGVKVPAIVVSRDPSKVTPDGFIEQSYELPEELTRASDGSAVRSYKCRFAPEEGSNFPGLYYLRLMNKE